MSSTSTTAASTTAESVPKAKPSIELGVDAGGRGEEEDDLDDLDDVLSQFNAPKSPLTSPPPPPPTASAATSSFTKPSSGNRPRTNTRVDAFPPPSSSSSGLPPPIDEEEDALTADFARELAKGMEGLMRELGAGTAAASSSSETKEEGEGDDEERQKAFMKAWEAMLVEGMNGVDLGDLPTFDGVGAPGVGGGADPGANAGGKADFQSKIQDTMNRLRENDKNLSSTPAPLGGLGDKDLLSGLGDKDLMEALLASLAEGGEGETDEDMATMMETMMGSLMSKEVLYEPLKELSEKFPAYLASPPPNLPPAELTRFESQYQKCLQIMQAFDDPKYDDEDPALKGKIMVLMDEMQSLGAPPDAIMGPMPAMPSMPW